MEDLSKIGDVILLDKIYTLRGQKVMLDFDLAMLYEVANRALKQSVKRNPKRFPADFMFQLTETEWQEVITNCDNLHATAKFSPVPPLAFTEQGVAMLSSVLKSDHAILVNIQIIRVFSRLREMASAYAEVRVEIEKIKAKQQNQDKNMEIVFAYLDELTAQKAAASPRKRIGYKPDD